MKSDLIIPRVNVNDDSVEVVHWYVEDNGRIEKGKDLVDVGTSKATVTLQAQATGFVRRLHPLGSEVKVGDSVATIFDSPQESKDFQVAKGGRESAPRSKETNRAGPGSFDFTRLSKSAEEMRAKHNVSMDQLLGKGMVSSRVMRNLLGISEQKEVKHSISKYFSLPDPPGGLRSEKLGKAKQAEIQALSIGQLGGIEASLTVQFQAANLFKMLRDRKLFGNSLLPIILFEVSRLLPKFPKFTSFYHEGTIQYYDQIHLGVALDLGSGLKVVTLKNADELMPVQIFNSIVDYSMKYMSNKLAIDEITGSTFTISDLSATGVLSFRPLINYYQSAILGIGGDKSMPDQPITLTITFDHRVLTGMEVANFLTTLKSRIISFDEGKGGTV